MKKAYNKFVNWVIYGSLTFGFHCLRTTDDNNSITYSKFRFSIKNNPTNEYIQQ